MITRPGENIITQQEKKPINHKLGKRLFGAIKKGQVWMKRDTGRCMQIFGKAKDDSFKVEFDGDSRSMKVHTIKSFDIYRYYILLEK